MGANHGNSLAALFPSAAMARLVVFFLVNPGDRPHVRELLRRTGLSSASLQHELRRLVGMGALRRTEAGMRACYHADEAHGAWRAWMLLLRAAAHPADVLREALVDADGIDVALVFGSVARGDAIPRSDVDVLLVGEPDATLEAGRRLVEAEMLIDRPIDVVAMDAEEFAARRRGGDAFLICLLAGPVLPLRGSVEPRAAEAA